jgi:hypothetical protein
MLLRAQPYLGGATLMPITFNMTLKAEDIDPADVRVVLYEVTELVRRYQDSFDWASVPIGKLRPR